MMSAVFRATAVLLLAGCVAGFNDDPHHHQQSRHQHQYQHQENLQLMHQPHQQQKLQDQHFPHHQQQNLQDQSFQQSFHQPNLLHQRRQQPHQQQNSQQQKQQQISYQQRVIGADEGEQREMTKERGGYDAKSAMMKSREGKMRDEVEMTMGGRSGRLTGKMDTVGNEEDGMIGDEAKESGTIKSKEWKMREGVEMTMGGGGERLRGKRDVMRDDGEMMMGDEGAAVIWQGGSEIVIVQKPHRLRREEDENAILREDSRDRTDEGRREEGNIIREGEDGEVGDEEEMRQEEKHQEETRRDSCQPMQEVALVTEALADLTRSIKILVDKTSSSAPCPHPFTRVGGECFYPHLKKLSWPHARRVCRGMGGDLAEPTHLYALQAHLADVFGPGYFWVGGTDQESEGQWRWVSGRALDPTDWLFSRPDNRNGNEHCLEMVMSDYPGLFNDETCDVAQRFICQYREEW